MLFLNNLSDKLNEANLKHRRIMFEGETIALADEKSSFDESVAMSLGILNTEGMNIR